MNEATISPTVRPRLAAGVRLSEDKLTGDAVLLYPEGVLKLNATGFAILRLCDGQRALADILCELSAEYGAEPGDLQTDVAAYLQRLWQRALIVLLQAGEAV